MELRQLRTFEAVVKHGTVTEAAHALDLAPSSVSAHIRSLEETVGAALFSRTPHGMRTTAAGDRMVEWARRLLDQAEQAVSEVGGAARRLRLGALETIAAHCVPAVLRRLSARQSGLRVETRVTGDRGVLLDEVTEGTLTAALLLDSGRSLGELGFPVPTVPLASLDVGTVPLDLVAAPSHPLAGHPLAPDDLAGERLLVNVDQCSFRLVAEQLLGPEVERVAAGGVPVMRAWAEQGLGIALLPRFAVADQLEHRRLVRLGLTAPGLALRLVWAKEREGEPEVRELLYAAAGGSGEFGAGGSGAGG
ncbi:LysR family transcriptional regulator [Streptomyces albus subsp. chlorinus]|uniref:LysR family transcriptional regulator n=1 Tax=Streptomyces albus TaxID=1888 RepID=UPI0015705382|nr:LysR family transcriptional regulator [Streptomyces albus]NSC19807.1 LysR family transcriptional regulator [Streptomyces albus subsp. chlorinus]